jgi:hypothetical protein
MGKEKELCFLLRDRWVLKMCPPLTVDRRTAHEQFTAMFSSEKSLEREQARLALKHIPATIAWRIPAPLNTQLPAVIFLFALNVSVMSIGL